MPSPLSPFPSVIDSSLINSFRSCPTQCRYEYIEHWKGRIPSVHLHAGSAFARGLEVAREAFYLEGLGESEAVGRGLEALMVAYGNFDCPPDSAKSCERMLGALEFYFSQYPLSKDHIEPIVLPSGGRGIEFSFVEPLDFPHPETGEPLLYSGRMDTVVNFAGGRFGEDDKTTTQLGASWSRQWDLRSQFTGYCWGAARANLPLDGFLVRGISILKTKYDTQQAITYRPQWMIDEWYEQLIERDLPLLQIMWETGRWSMSLGEACNAYGGCMFSNVCKSAPENRLEWLRGGYERRRWDPITRLEIHLG